MQIDFQADFTFSVRPHRKYLENHPEFIHEICSKTLTINYGLKKTNEIRL